MKHRQIWITVIALAVVSAVVFGCISLSGGLLAQTAEQGKNTLVTEKQTSGTAPAPSPDEAQAQMTQSAAPAPGVPDNTALSERLEKAGASFELLEALNNPLPKDAERELTRLIGAYEKAPENSDERYTILEQIVSMVIPGVNEALGGEMKRADAVGLMQKTMEKAFGIDVSNWKNQFEVHYRAGNMLAANESRSFWDISGATDKIRYTVRIDAKAGEVFSADWMGMEESEASTESVLEISGEQSKKYSGISRDFAEKNFAGKELSILNCTPVIPEKQSTYNGEIVKEGTTVRVNVALSDGTIVYLGINTVTDRVFSFVKTMAWDKQ
jgi:hypothetical protein